MVYQELLKLWIHHQYLADKDEERFLDSIWTVAKVCRDTEQIGVLIDGVKKEVLLFVFVSFDLLQSEQHFGCIRNVIYLNGTSECRN